MNQHGHDVGGLVARIAWLTISDSRTEADDRSAKAGQALIVEAGHSRIDYCIRPDEPEQVQQTVVDWLGRDDCDCIITSGGTGISTRDQTYEALHGLLDSELVGFGELFRMLSWQEIASAAMLSRAFGGISRRRLLFCLPGSTAAVRLGLERLILPELSHLLAEMRKR